MKRLRFFLALLTDSMLIGMILLVYLDGRNPTLYFLTSISSKVYTLLMCAVGLASTILCLRDLK